MTPISRRATAELSKRASFLHIVPDDKFIDDARGVFEDASPGSHRYVVLRGGANSRLIKTFEPWRIESEDALRELLLEVHCYDVVFIHFLDDAARLFIDRCPAKTRFVWLGWGADYYHLLSSRENLILADTRKLLCSLDSINHASKTLGVRLRSVMQAAKRPILALRRHRAERTLKRIGRGKAEEMQLLNRIELFAPVLWEEFEALTSMHSEFTPQFAEWNYWSGLERVTPTAGHESRNILLGNSATPENNHLEAMQLLPAGVLRGRKIICPLSYGDITYGDSISAAGHQTYGDSFVALRAYLGTEDYLDTLRSCSIAAMNHVRQQGVGNIVVMLWLGARVFLNHRSPVGRELSSLGIEIFDIRGLPEYLAGSEQPLRMDGLTDIRDRLRHRFGRPTLLRMTEKLLAQLSAPTS